MKDLSDQFFPLLRYALWGSPMYPFIERLSHEQYTSLMQVGEEQAVIGMLSQALIDNNVKLESDDVFDVVDLTQSIGQMNKIIDEATMTVCRMMKEKDIRILVVKGQTLAPMYRYPTLRQCGDVDFLCHSEDLEKAVRFLRDDLAIELNDEGSNKHAGFMMDDVKYEIHRTLTNFAYPAHQRYWEDVVMKEVWQNPYTKSINNICVPTLPPTYNAIYIFVHIMFHLIVDGVGLRQFCDWAMVLDKDGHRIDKQLLRRHLNGIGLLDAYSGLGAVLTDFLGLPQERFPLEMSDSDHRRAACLVGNIMKFGNFGHNIEYRSLRGPFHAIEHAVRMGRQGWRFCHYAPKEVLWRIPYFMGWWGKRVFRSMTPYLESSKSVFQKAYSNII